jgi:hypothetical protein
MNSKRPKVEPIRDPVLFQLDKAGEMAGAPESARPFDIPGVLLACPPDKTSLPSPPP